jgi:RHS repeat-associated protein
MEADEHLVAYTGLDTRVSKTDSGGTTSYRRVGATVTDSLLKSTVSSTTTDYTPGVSSRVGFDSTFLHSGIKNADTQTDEGGDVSAMRRYDAFGNPVAAWGGWQGPFGYGGPYGYQTDPDHGLMLLGHRYYEADTGRFLTRDPIKDGRNWYGYCDGNPLTLLDPAGLSFTDFVAGWGDTLTFGGTKYLRKWIGEELGYGDANEAVDYGSPHYGYGEIAGIGHSLLLGGAGGLKVGGKAAGTTFSHFIPNRAIKRVLKHLPEDSLLHMWVKRFGRSRWNGNYVSPGFHHRTDYYYRLPGLGARQGMLPEGLAQLLRVPTPVAGSLGGWGLGTTHWVGGRED